MKQQAAQSHPPGLILVAAVRKKTAAVKIAAAQLEL